METPTLTREENAIARNAASAEIDALQNAFTELQEHGGENAQELREEIVNQLRTARERYAQSCVNEFHFMYAERFGTSEVQ